MPTDSTLVRKRVDGKLNFWAVPNHAAEVSLYKERKRTRFLQPDELLRFNRALADEENTESTFFDVGAFDWSEARRSSRHAVGKREFRPQDLA